MCASSVHPENATALLPILVHPYLINPQNRDDCEHNQKMFQ